MWKQNNRNKKNPVYPQELRKVLNSPEAIINCEWQLVIFDFLNSGKKMVVAESREEKCHSILRDEDQTSHKENEYAKRKIEDKQVQSSFTSGEEKYLYIEFLCYLL